MTAPRTTEHGDRIHDLKCWPLFFGDVATRRKEFEVRRDDRSIQAGDWLLLHEWDPADTDPARIVYEPRGYTGRKLIRYVTYVLRGQAGIDAGLRAGFCVLGLAHSEAAL